MADQPNTTSTSDAAADPYLWLEEVTGPKALAWVRARNAVVARDVESKPMFEEMRKRILSILDSRERIPYVRKHGKYLYNFWRDDRHVRGLWRRTTMAEYKKPQPVWETVIDLDALAAGEKENWVWKGANVLEPTYDRGLILLSRGGADAIVVREFDLEKKQFVAGGFALPEAKTQIQWRNRNTVYVGTDFGPGSMTNSGYPRIVKEWKRGEPLSEAPTVMEGYAEDVSVAAHVERDHGRTYEWIARDITFFTSDYYVRRGDAWVRIEKPADATLDTFDEYLLVQLKSDWNVNGKTYRAGTLLAEKFDDYLAGKREFAELFIPSERVSLASTSATKGYLLLNTLENVSGHVYLLRPGPNGWERSELKTPALGSVSAEGVDDEESDDYFLMAEGFLTPPTLWLGEAGKEGREELNTLPSFFDSAGMEVEQFETVSKDGTRVPYFLVSKRGLKRDGKQPTLLYGYGGFEISLTPAYSPAIGTGWLERGGAYVVANIRGGGEFGPTWHNAARKQHRQRAYNDFIAVAEDLVARKVTSPKHLGIMGGSNGGLLMGVMMTQRPELFGGVVCMVPLLDMRRYNKLLAGASWMDEYGDPDKAEEWSYLQKFSPYQNVRAGVTYPPVLFMTSTRDDRVHPGHARKMAARLESMGAPVWFFENTEGGHAAADTNTEVARTRAMAYTFLWEHLR